MVFHPDFDHRGFQSVATLSCLLFVNWDMVIQSNLNFKRRLVRSGVGSGENCCGTLSPCLFPSTISSYFLLICSFKLCAKSWALLVWLCSVSTEFLWVYFYVMKSLCLVFPHNHAEAVTVHELNSKLQLNSILKVHEIAARVLDC